MKNKVTDLSYLWDLTGKNKTLIKKYILIFQETVPGEINELKSFFEQQDKSRIKSIVHAMKAKVLYMGMKDVHEKLGKIESSILGTAHVNDLKSELYYVEYAIREAQKELTEELNLLN
jgi:hypothetical protein